MEDDYDYMDIPLDIESNKDESYSKKRMRKLNSTNGITKPKYFKAQEELDISLQKEISANNKGFKMLQKMGFKPGEKIGRNDSGLKAPVQIVLKNDKKGLGSSDSKWKYESLQEKKQKEELRSVLHQDYRAAKNDSHIRGMVETDLKKARSTCMSLDETHLIQMTPFWPPIDIQESNEFEDQLAQIKLIQVLDYLRSKYFYCLYCGIEFRDDADMLAECPGSDRRSH